MTGAIFNPKTRHLPEVYEAFPFWTEEEIKAAKVEKYKAIMMRHAHSKGGEDVRQRKN